MAKQSLKDAVQAIGLVDDELSPPQAGKPRPAEVASDDLPRVLDQDERAEDGWKRYRVRSVFSELPVTYIAARSEAEAKAHYRQVHNQDEDSALIVRTMAD